MNAPEKHSAIVGGSTAGRLLACPGSWRLIQSLPPEVDKPSTYAVEGTALHEAMYALADGMVKTPWDLLGFCADSGYEIEQRHVDECLAPAWRMLQGLLPDSGEYDLVLEERVEFPGIPDAFGTVDLAVRAGSILRLVDYKFGSGIAVDATNNPQLLYYACALRHSLPELFKRLRRLELVIIQPRLLAEPAIYPVKLRDLDKFEAQLIEAVRLAQAPQPPLNKGDHCRFCRAKTICPEWTYQLDTLGDLLKVMPIAEEFPQFCGGYGALLGEALRLAADVERWIAEARAQAHAMLEAGKSVPGWKLVPKRAYRRWVDEGVAAEALIDLGFLEQEILVESMATPAALEKAGKARGLTIPPELVTATSNGTTLAPEGDPRPERPALDVALDEFADLADAYLNPKGTTT